MITKSNGAKFILPLIGFLLVSGCSNTVTTENDTSINESIMDNSVEEDTENIAQSNSLDQEDAEIITLSDILDEEDVYSDWNNDNPNYIELKGDSIESTSANVEITDNTLTILKGGVYVLSGSLENGQIIVASEDDEVVRLVLNGVDISDNDSAPIYVKQADKVVLSLEEGTTNTLTDGTEYVLEEGSDEPNATIYSKEDLTINGEGTLIVYGNYNNGISSKDDLNITGGSIKVYAEDDGIMGRDSVIISDGEISIEAGGDGIKTTNDEDAEKGSILLTGGTYEIIAGGDGIQAETAVYMKGGTFDIITGGGNNNSQAINDSDTSMKGIKASTDIVIENGTFNLDTTDDGIHSDHSITILDGTYYILTGDDGINLAGSDELAIDSMEQLTIEGGNIVVDAEGNGFNANGAIVMTGGTAIINGDLDYDASFELTGGSLFAVGSADLSQVPSESTQNSVIMTFDSEQEAGTLIHLEDSEGNNIVTFAPNQSYQSVIISTNELVENETYKLYTGGTVSGESVNGTYDSYEAGELITEFTITESITYLD